MASKKILTLVREKQAACKRIEAGEEQIHQLKNLLVTMKALTGTRISTERGQVLAHG